MLMKQICFVTEVAAGLRKVIQQEAPLGDTPFALNQATVLA